MTHAKEYIQIQKYLFARDVEGVGIRVADRASGVWDGGGSLRRCYCTLAISVASRQGLWLGRGGII